MLRNANRPRPVEAEGGDQVSCAQHDGKRQRQPHHIPVAPARLDVLTPGDVECCPRCTGDSYLVPNEKPRRWRCENCGQVFGVRLFTAGEGGRRG